jgi:hypothetical protein
MKDQPTFYASSVVELPEKDQGLQHSIARLYSARLDREKKDPTRFRRRQPILVVNESNGAQILRFVMGSKNGGIKKNQVSLDYDGVDALGVRFEEKVTLTVRPAKKRDVIRHFLDHPDMQVQVSMKFALWGVLLGMFGAVAGALSILIAFL